MPLNFDPANAEDVQLGFKVSGCEVTSSSDPGVVVVYDHTTNGKTVRGAYDMVESYSYIDGKYMVLTFKLSNEFKNADFFVPFILRLFEKVLLT